MMSKEKVINRGRVRVARLSVVNNIEAHTMAVLFFGVGIVLFFGILNIFTHRELTNIAHKVYVADKQINHTLREIDSMKLELLKNTNILNIQSESSSNGFVFNNDLKFVK